MSEPVWRVDTKRQVKRMLRRLPKPLAGRITAAIDKLADNPYPPGSLKLAGYANLYRVRVGDWRIIYTPDEAVLTILIVKVAPRREVYRKL